jgi:putative Holliday junction resolvase
VSPIDAPGRALGLDLGSHRIGVAISDDRRAVATPLEVVGARDRAAADRRIGEIIDEWEPTVVVVGIPLQLDGGRGVAVRRTMKVFDRLRATFSLPFVTYDERLTTVTAHRSLDEQNVRSRDRREMVDMVAAQVILQGWMDKERT